LFSNPLIDTIFQDFFSVDSP